MKRIIITGYFDRNDGPSVFVRNLSCFLSKKYEVKSIASRFSLNDFINLMKADSVLLNSSNLMPLLILLLRPVLSKKKYISIIHGELGLGMKFSLKKLLLRVCEYLMIKCSDRLVFVSSLQMHSFLEKYKIKNAQGKCQVIFNGVEVGEFQPNFTKDKLIVYVGGENDKKGRAVLDSFIELFSCQDAAKGYQLYLYGMSHERSYAINNLTVIAKNKISHKEILAAYKKSEIFLSLSEFETFGIACVEAYCLGNKVVCYKSSGFLEVVDDCNVYVVNDYRHDLFCTALVDALEGTYCASPDIIKKVSIEAMAADYINLIELEVI